MTTAARATRFPAAGPGFNRAAAEVVYKRIMACPDDATAALYSAMLLGAGLRHDLAVHGGALSKALAQVVGQRAQAMRANLARSAVAKHRAGDTAGQDAAIEALGALVGLGAIAKADWQEDQHHRDEQGEFARHESNAFAARVRHDALRGNAQVRASTAIRYPVSGRGLTPLDDAYAARAGIHPPHGQPQAYAGPLSDEQRARYQHAYAQVGGLLTDFAHVPAGDGMLHLKYADDDAEVIQALPRGGQPIPIDPSRTLASARVSTFAHPGHEPFSTEDALAALGGRSLGPALATAYLAPGSAANVAGLQAYKSGMAAGADDQDAHMPSRQAYRRMTHGSKLLDATLGPVLPAKARMALQVAGQIGEYGPEAQKVMGPTADRAAYRYRGTERPVDAKLANAWDSVGLIAQRSAAGAAQSQRHREQVAAHEAVGQRLRRTQLRHEGAADQLHSDIQERVRAGTITANEGAQELDRYLREQAPHDTELAAAAKAELAAHQRSAPVLPAAVMTHGEVGALHRDLAVGGTEDAEGNWVPSPVLTYMRGRLPSPELSTLQRKSGIIPPSEGVIIDKNGKIVIQAVGFGDDHYLPFNMKNLTKLKGGQYIRTRSFGGPTTEDIYTGLVAGASSVTVVSHSGVFTVTFDDSLRGARRYNDKAARMVGRYAHLLDAVRSGKVTTGGVSTSRYKEIEDEARAAYDPDYDQAGYEKELTRLKNRQADRPQLSALERATATEEFLAAYAAKRKTADGHEMGVPELADQVATAAAARERQADLDRYGNDIVGNVGLAQYKAQQEVMLADADPAAAGRKLAAALGVEPKLDAHLLRTEKAAAQLQKELQLNGPGYDLALQALREQFPYYLREPVYHPWADVVERRDTGYVRPTRNRAADAWSGYFDEQIAGGKGKAYADSTRYQADEIRYVDGAKVGTDEDDLPAGARRRAAAGTATAAAGASGAAPASTPAEEEQLAVEAQMALIRHMQSSAFTFNPAHLISPVIGGQDSEAFRRQIENRPVADFVHLFGNDMPGLSRVLTANLRDLRTDPNRKADLDRALREVERNNLATFPSDLLRAAQHNGKPQPVALAAETAAMLADPDADYAFGGAAYDTTRAPSADQIAAHYAKEPAIVAAVAAGRLPADVADPGLTTAADAELEVLHALHVTELRRKRGDRGVPSTPPAGIGELARRVEAQQRARQLRRNYDSALVRDANLAAQQAAAAPPEVHIPVFWQPGTGPGFVAPAGTPPPGQLRPIAPPPP